MSQSTQRFTDPSYFAKYSWLEYLFILCACMGQLITMSATTDVLTHMNQLKEDFNAPAAMTPWYMASFGLSVGTSILVSGRYGDVFGIKKALLGGYIWTVIWSLSCGFAWYTRHLGPSFYVVARTFQGTGVSFILPNILGAVGRIYTPGTLRKKIVFGLIGFCAPMGGWSGVFMSGVIGVKTRDWYWNYYAFSIFATIALILTLICVPDSPPTLNEDGSQQDLDIIGSILGVGALVLFNFSWNQAPVVGWHSAYIITLLVVGVALFIVFILYEIHIAKNPLLPKAVLENGRLVGTSSIIFLGWGAFGVNIYHYFTLVQDFRHYTPFAAGAGLSPAPPMGLIAAISCSLIISPKTVEFILSGSMLAFLTFSIVLTTAGIEESYWRNTSGMWIVGPFGMDWSFPASSIMLSEVLPPQYQGMAGSLVTVMMNYGISIFLGVAGTVEQELINARPDDTWRAWRGAEYFSIGISGMASLVAFVFVLTRPKHPSVPRQPSGDNEKSSEHQETDSGNNFSTINKKHADNDTISALSV